MSKLIYAHSAQLLESTYSGIKDADQVVNTVYQSIAFTGDGYLYTHGKKFRLFRINGNNFEGITFNVNNGVASLLVDNEIIGQGSILQSITGDGIVIPTTTNGVVSLTHKSYISDQDARTYGSNSRIPIITIDAYGHISAASESNIIDVTKVQAQLIENPGTYYITGITNGNLQNPYYSNDVYFDAEGNLHANNIYFNGDTIQGQFAPLSHIDVIANGSTLGHVTLSDILDSANDASQGVAATPKSVYSALQTSKNYTEALIAAQDAMIFVGTLSSSGTIHSHNVNVLANVIDDTTSITEIPYSVGWTFRFTTSGTFQGESVEVGDMIIAIRDKGASFSTLDWTIIQTNISGALTSANTPDGILYTSNSRSVNSLSFGNGLLKSDGATISFINPNTVWRDIQINNVTIGTNTLNLIQGSNINLASNNGEIVISANASSVLNVAGSLTLLQDQVSFVYQPGTSSTINIGDNLSLINDEGTYTLRHASINAVTNAFGRITTDGYGHIVSVDPVTSIANPNPLNFVKGNTTYLQYDGSSTCILNFIEGNDIDIALSLVENTLTITPSIVHKYRPVQFVNGETNTVLLQNSTDTVLTLIAGDNISILNTDINSDPLPDGNIIISAEDTWRNIEAYKFQGNLMTRSSIGSAVLRFNDDFILSQEEIGLCWTEIDELGRVTYTK